MSFQPSEAGSGHELPVLCNQLHVKENWNYIIQVTVIVILMVGSILNLSFNSDNSSVWLALLSSAVGYILPAPEPKKRKQDTPLQLADEH
jgi:hypothetical protein